MSAAAEAFLIKTINEGVCRFEAGDFEGATLAFSRALTISRREFQLHQYKQSKFCGSQQGGHDDDSDEQSIPFQPDFARCEKITVPGVSDVFVFLNPMKVPLHKTPNFKIHHLTLISLFNLAICHHRYAIAHNMDRESLRRALKLYESTYTIQMTEGIDMTLSPTMIIMSNVGHIHKFLGNHESAHQCFQHLLSTLMFLVEAGERELVWEFEGFFENVMHTIYANPPAAAA
jgi:tetratricopeptide (TPR) repeat protein